MQPISISLYMHFKKIKNAEDRIKMPYKITQDVKSEKPKTS